MSKTWINLQFYKLVYLAILNIPQMCLKYESNIVPVANNAIDPIVITAFRCKRKK